MANFSGRFEKPQCSGLKHGLDMRDHGVAREAVDFRATGHRKPSLSCSFSEAGLSAKTPE